MFFLFLTLSFTSANPEHTTSKHPQHPAAGGRQLPPPRVPDTRGCFLFVKLVQTDQQVIAFKNVHFMHKSEWKGFSTRFIYCPTNLGETSQDKRWGPSWTGPCSITGLTHRQLHTLTFTFNESITIEQQQPPKRSQWLHLVTGYK